MKELLNRSNQNHKDKRKYTPSPDELLNCSVFDFVCYAALLKNVLGVDIDQVK